MLGSDKNVKENEMPRTVNFSVIRRKIVLQTEGYYEVGVF